MFASDSRGESFQQRPGSYKDTAPHGALNEIMFISETISSLRSHERGYPDRSPAHPVPESDNLWL